MKKYRVTVMELRTYRIYMEVEAETELHAEEKAIQGAGKVITERILDVDHVDAIEVIELEEVELDCNPDEKKE